MLRGMAGGQEVANEPLGQLDWNFSQVFGERTPGEEVQDGRAHTRTHVESMTNVHLCDSTLQMPKLLLTSFPPHHRSDPSNPRFLCAKKATTRHVFIASDRRRVALTLPTADIISAVEFDKTGEHLATGDRGGRVVLFERLHSSKSTMVSFWGCVSQQKRKTQINKTRG